MITINLLILKMDFHLRGNGRPLHKEVIDVIYKSIFSKTIDASLKHAGMTGRNEIIDASLKHAGMTRFIF